MIWAAYIKVVAFHNLMNGFHDTVYAVYLAVILIWRFGDFLSVCQI